MVVDDTDYNIGYNNNIGTMLVMGFGECTISSQQNNTLL